jgi:hypothetical protein
MRRIVPIVSHLWIILPHMIMEISNTRGGYDHRPHRPHPPHGLPSRNSGISAQSLSTREEMPKGSRTGPATGTVRQRRAWVEIRGFATLSFEGLRQFLLIVLLSMNARTDAVRHRADRGGRCQGLHHRFGRPGVSLPSTRALSSVWIHSRSRSIQSPGVLDFRSANHCVTSSARTGRNRLDVAAR